MHGTFGVYIKLVKYLHALESKMNLKQGLEPITFGTKKTYLYHLTIHYHMPLKCFTRYNIAHTWGVLRVLVIHIYTCMCVCVIVR